MFGTLRRWIGPAIESFSLKVSMAREVLSPRLFRAKEHLLKEVRTISHKMPSRPRIHSYRPRSHLGRRIHGAFRRRWLWLWEAE